VGRAALIIAKDVYPDLDIRAYSSKIDDLVMRIQLLVRGSTDPDYRVRALNTLLFSREGFKYDYSDPFAKKLNNCYLNGILDTKRGSCVTMPVLYLSVAQRLGYPVYMATAPDHYFLRYVDPRLKEQNIEATGGGGYSSDSQYIKDFQIPEKAIKNGEYLRTLTHRELLADLISQNAIFWAKKGDIQRAIRYLEHCVKVFPTSGGINETLGYSYLIYQQDLKGEEALKYYEKGVYHRRKAQELGFLRLPMDEYVNQMKNKAKEERKGNKGGN
jgi:regulator of sirC expression with transglutaminase-like and TPR domain